eukprot:2363998-Pyramimonas_sp.AAC.1
MDISKFSWAQAPDRFHLRHPVLGGSQGTGRRQHQSGVRPWSSFGGAQIPAWGPAPEEAQANRQGMAPCDAESAHNSRLDHAVQDSPPHTLSDLEHVVREVANECGSGPKRARNDKFWNDAEFQSLLE